MFWITKKSFIPSPLGETNSEILISPSSGPGSGSGLLSHASPFPSPSVSSWSGLAIDRQLSHTSPTPSPSLSS